MSKQLLAIGNQHQLVDWGTPQDQQISQIPSSSWLVGAVLEQPRLSLMRAWLDAAEQSWAQSTVLLVAVVSLIVRWHVSAVSLNAERSKILESLYKSGTSRIFSSLLCQLCCKRRSCHIRKDALQLSQLPPQVQWGIAASPPWPNLAQFQKSLPLRVSSDWLRSSKTQQRKVKNFIFLYRTGFQIIWKNMFSPL